MNRTRKILAAASATALLALSLGFVGCVKTSGGEWYIHSAALPEGWPQLTPVGEVQVKAYPLYRSAEVSALSVGSSDSSLFRELFRHISSEDIAMTAPVEMRYNNDDGGDNSMAAMAFYYRDTSIGSTGTDGNVVVEDIEPQQAATVGVRGPYSTRNYEKGLMLVRDWLDENPQWQPDGEPRYLGYNGPFVLWFMRYGEVQVPVREVASE